MKVALQIKNTIADNPNWNPRATVIHISKSLPFFQSSQGSYVHRVRSAKMHYWIGVYSHSSLSLWCGMGGCFGSKKRKYAKLLAEVPEGEVLCATCEGRAIGAGQTDSRMICGHMVKFSPRI